MTDVRAALRAARGELERAGVPSPHVDADLLVGHVLGRSRTALYAEPARELSLREEIRLRSLLRRRASREPLAYVLGEWGFRRLTLRIDDRVLVPRPETESVVERCLALLRDLPEPDVLDLGTGSGAIALALADEHPGARVLAVDSEPGALALARENAVAAGLEHRIRLVERDLAEVVPGERFDLVVSNPPYVAAAELDGLEPEVRDWEPRVALVGAGLHRVAGETAREVLRRGGRIVLEAGDSQAPEVADVLVALGFRGVRISADLGGRDRVVEGTWPD
ncbi:MAG: peptide chain release factor N(5)-glutamine methyltransferase [Gaiellaceae bacterium]